MERILSISLKFRTKGMKKTKMERLIKKMSSCNNMKKREKQRKKVRRRMK